MAAGFPFRPALVPTIFVVIALVILVNLGLWQLRRHAEMQDRMTRVEAQLRGEPARAGDLGAPPEALEWRMAEVTGRYLDVDPALITGRFEYGDPGYDVVQPMQVDGGPLILVNRGWLPYEGFAGHLEATRPDGPVTVRGLIQPVRGAADEPAIPASGDHPVRWKGPNYAGMAKAWGLQPHLVIVEGEPLAHPEDKDPNRLPMVGFVARPRLRPHLEYAGTWFLIGLTLLGLWTYGGVLRARELREADEPAPPHSPS